MEKQSYLRYSTYREQVDELLDVSCALLVSGGQILEGDVELFVKRNISMIPSEVPHSSTKVRVNSKNRIPEVSLQQPEKPLAREMMPSAISVMTGSPHACK